MILKKIKGLAAKTWLWFPFLFFLCTEITGAMGLSYRNLAEQLDDLAYRHDFVIDGLEIVEDKPPRRIRGDLPRKLERLLAGLNYATVLRYDQSIERIIILGEKPVLPQRLILPTRKVGNNHTIEAQITGANGKQIDVSLLIDTGADYLVLPLSLMETFEIDPDLAETRKLQTANGLTEARMAKVARLKIGGEVIDDLEAAFVADEQLGDTKLLGMNVLKRYRVTIDDRAQTITLIRAE